MTSPKSSQIQWDSLSHIDSPRMILIDDTQKSLYAIVHTEIFQYSFEQNAWNKHPIMNHLPKDFFLGSPSFFINSQHLYIHGGYPNRVLLKVHLDAAKYSPQTWKVDNGDGIFTPGAKMIMIGDELHVIGGRYNRAHHKWNKQTLHFDKLHVLVFSYPQVVKLKHEILSFGGWWDDYGCCLYLDEMHIYDTINNQWRVSNITMPRGMIVDGIASVLNQQFIILFGGNGKYGAINDIWIYSVGDKVFRKSKVKCPGKRGGKVLVINNPQRDELSVLGYMRSQWKECGIYENLFPPRYLIKIINRYYWNEWIHLVDNNDGKHWKINVFDIINDA